MALNYIFILWSGPLEWKNPHRFKLKDGQSQWVVSTWWELLKQALEKLLGFVFPLSQSLPRWLIQGKLFSCIIYQLTKTFLIISFHERYFERDLKKKLKPSLEKDPCHQGPFLQIMSLFLSEWSSDENAFLQNYFCVFPRILLADNFKWN